jgi:hypothetical protein
MADAVLEILKVIQGDIAGLKTDMSSVKADLGGVKTEVRVHSRTLDILLQEGRLLRAAVNDLPRKTSLRVRWKQSTTTLIACGMRYPSLRFASK